MTVTLGAAVWFVFGVGLSVVHGLLIVWTVGALSPGGGARVWIGVLAGYLMRYLTTVLAMTLAVQDGAASCVAVALGMLVGRWFAVRRGALGRVMWPRLG